MQRRLFNHVRAGVAINFVNQRRFTAIHENVGRVILELHVHAADERALRQIPQQRPNIHKTRVEILVKNPRRLGFRSHFGSERNSVEVYQRT